MASLKAAFFNQLGQKSLIPVKAKFERQYDSQVKLLSVGYDEGIERVKSGQADLFVTNFRETEADLKAAMVDRKALKVILPWGSYPRGIQMVEKADLHDATCFIVAQPQEEAAELHLFKDLYKIASPLMAANSVEEAELLVASGSGYFIMNELTASMLNNDAVQSLFLLDQGQQMWQKIVVFYQKDAAKIQDFIKLLKK